MQAKFLLKYFFVYFLLILFLFIAPVTFGQEGGESYSTQDNTASFDSNVSTNDISVDPGTIGYAEVTANETANADGSVTFDGTTVVGPEGTTAEVTVNSDGTFTVSFSSPGNDISPVETEVTFDSSQSDNSGNSIGGGGDTVNIDAPDPNPTYPYIEGGPPVLTGTTGCQGGQPVVDLSWTPSPLSDGIVHDWRVLKSGVFGTYISRWRTETNFRDSMAPPQQILDPETIYYYRVYGYRGVNRSPLSNIVAVLTPSCAPKVVASCPDTNSGTIENLNVSWASNSSGINGFKLYRGTDNNVQSRVFLPPNIPSNTTSKIDSSLVLGQTYNYWLTSYKTVVTPAYTEITSTDENGNPTGFIDHPETSVDIESPFSAMSVGLAPKLCQTGATPIEPTVPTPTIQLTLTTPDGVFNSNDLPVSVKQNDPITLNWQITNATSATATSSPLINSWNGTVNPVSGLTTIPTSTVGSYLLSLTAVNGTNNATSTIQINVKVPTEPYIKTTQGDVHSNNDIKVPQ